MAKDVTRELIESDVRIKDMDMRTAVVYVATNCSMVELTWDGLAGVVPRRLHKCGRRPARRTHELTGGIGREEK